MTGQIFSILVAPEHGVAQTPMPSAELQADVGLVGDRYAGSGVVSLIEREGIDAFKTETGLDFADEDVRRNIVTQGIGLNALVGKRFRVGDAELEGTELCEPCASLGNSLSEGNVSPADVVKHFLTSAGLRARVITGGHISPGDAITQV